MTERPQAVPRKNWLLMVFVGAGVIAVVGTLIVPGWRNPCQGDEDGEEFGITVVEPGGNELVLRRSKNWYNPGLGAGKWIGTAANLGPGPSTAYSKLEPNRKGCVKFKYTGGTNGETAKLHVIGEGAPRALTFALYCGHRTNHPNDIKPKYEEVPEQCDKFVYRINTSVGVRVDSLDFAAISVASLAVRLDSIASRLAVSGVPQLEADSLTAMVGVKGPWYPCASAGCCRAWGM